MKKKFLLSLLTLSCFNLQAQFILNGLNYGNTMTGMRGIGIGDFLINATVPASRFHINNFYCNQPNGILNGLLFRTDGRNNVENQWQLFTGPTDNNITEKFKLFVPASSTNVFLQASQNGGNMLFNTGGAISRMIIRDGTDDQFSGRIGMGNDLTATFAPQDRLHLYETFGG
ncbi:MAG: hypothetical protein ACO1O6_06625 [Bacteroidota bacterium]